ncbi:hypothetical protein FOMG_17765 [Fusarium oxysporum f. sp. melonis 26406]|uniref:Uncharacterized protein n=2 Tax=Fusarium oxysporum TaxID=5507 RepID=A0A2H3GCC1_FUSOX|nr:hypothetical protein FOMG_17765 [Fusarium oxysporum f. sp. melonis 26406]PCD21932.1 hypothetical protein AU210_015735 [Fusarium oxysporum f. sp. radicis-cucumerinum]
MLAVQMRDRDLRVWSVAKYSADDTAKVVRNLWKAETSMDGPNWMGWSKNGRITQSFDSRTLSWNQFDLSSPAIMVANVQYAVNMLPPLPPVSEETGDQSATSATTIAPESETSSISLDLNISERDEDLLSPFAHLTRHKAYDSGIEPYESASPVSSRSGLSSLLKPSAGLSQTPGRYPGSMRSRGLSENTYISAKTSIRPSTINNNAHGNTRDLAAYSMGHSLGTTSVPSMASSCSGRRPSRLHNEVPRSPDFNKVHNLLEFTRARISDIPYKITIGTNSTRLANDDLRRQRLNTIIGWNIEVEDLIRAEISKHPQGSASRIILGKWLGDIDPNIINAYFENMTSSDRMLLALSGIGAHSSQQKLGHIYVQRLLEAGGVHTAVTIILGIGDHNDTIKPLVFENAKPTISENGENEFTQPLASTSAAKLNFQAMTPNIPEVLSSPLSPPGVQCVSQRSITKISALFAGDGGQTPIAAGVTPIADSAGSPAFSDAHNDQVTTGFLRPSSNSRFNTPVSV